MCDEIAENIELAEPGSHVEPPSNGQDAKVPQVSQTAGAAPISDSASSSEPDGENYADEVSSVTSVEDDPQAEVPVKGQDGTYKRVEKMSLGQSRLWFLSIYLEDHTTYNCTTSYRLTGPLDIPRLEKSFAIVTKRHESFRTSFFTDMYTGQATQAVSDKSTFKLKKIK